MYFIWIVIFNSETSTDKQDPIVLRSVNKDDIYFNTLFELYESISILREDLKHVKAPLPDIEKLLELELGKEIVLDPTAKKLKIKTTGYGGFPGRRPPRGRRR